MMPDPPPASPPVTRFAPSPTGHLHLGHALAAFVAHDLAREGGGRFLLRLEDLDATRCRPEYEAAILRDLAWLGLRWEEPVWRQSERLPAYRQALDRLTARGLTYPCFCSRREIAEEIARMGAAPHGPPHGSEGPPYPGTCRALPAEEREARIAAGQPFALRLDAAAALLAADGAELDFLETGQGPEGQHGPQAVTPAQLPDIVLARKEVAVSYHLAVVVDDAAQGVTLVSRGEDLFGATPVQRLLQVLLGLPAPAYHHHRLVTDPTGRRLAKRDRDLTLEALREAGVTPAEIRRRVGLT
jgi:glutamyl-Q tRNA(Asp) synthetase